MEKEQIFAVIKKNLIEILPELANREIKVNDSLRELGANSVDRAEILIKSLAELQLKAPLIDFANAKNIEELISIFIEKLQSQNK